MCLVKLQALLSFCVLFGFLFELFNESSCENFVPRALFIDSELMVVDEIRSGAFKNLFHPDSLINTMEDASNCFGRGKHIVGRNDGIVGTRFWHFFVVNLPQIPVKMSELAMCANLKNSDFIRFLLNVCQNNFYFLITHKV